MKIRIYEMAKELGLDNKVLVTAAQKIGIAVKSHSSSLDPIEVERIRIALRAQGLIKPPPPPPPKPSPSMSGGRGAPQFARPTGAGGSPFGRREGTYQKASPGGPSSSPARGPGGVPGRPGEGSPFTVKVISEKGTSGEQVKHVKLERIAKKTGRTGPPGRPGGGGYGGRRDDHRHSASGRMDQQPAEFPIPKSISIEVPIPVKNLSAALGVKAGELLRHLMDLGVMTTINQTLDGYAVGLIAEKLGIEVKTQEQKKVEEEVLVAEKDKPEDLKARAPVVTVMGHVDHGKTSLLDRIRKTSVAEGEVGGITQHVGAYRVKLPKGGAVVFLDTPGHAAFTQMRARGANITDIVVLVAAADDGVMPQTEEAVSHARAANVPIVVAITKIDKPGANVQKVKEQLTRLELVAEEWGGKVAMMPVSAITGEGVDALLERLLLEAEVLDLKVNPSKRARGTVIEARMREDRGVVANVLIQEGTLKLGDVIVCGHAQGKVRSLTDDQGKTLTEAGPSTPVEVTGLSEVPDVGSKFYAVESQEKAREVASSRADKLRANEIAQRQHVTLENLFSQIAEKKVRAVNVILKADVRGSLEVLSKSLQDLSTAEVKVRIILQGVGAVSEADVDLAQASDAIILGFHADVEPKARALADQHSVDIRAYQIIYQLIDDMKLALEGLLAPEEKEVISGRLDVKQSFSISRIGTIAGGAVVSGILKRNAKVRVYRDGAVIKTGTINTLRRFKDDVREVKAGLECGAQIEGYDDVKVGDVLETYEIQKVARRLEQSIQKPAPKPAQPQQPTQPQSAQTPS